MLYLTQYIHTVLKNGLSEHNREVQSHKLSDAKKLEPRLSNNSFVN